MIATHHKQGFHKKLAKNVNVCFVDTGQPWQIVYLYISLALFYVIPCLSLFVLYGNIVFVIRKRSRKQFLVKANSTDSNQNANLLVDRMNTAAADQISLYEQASSGGNRLATPKDARQTGGDAFNTNMTLTVSQEHLKRASSGRRSAKSRKNSSFNARPTSKSAHNLPQINQKQIIILLIVMMLSIFICLLPYRVFSLWMANATKPKLEKLGLVNYYNLIAFCRVTFYMNSALNPIFYHIISTKFQTAFKRFFRFSYRSSQNTGGQNQLNRNSKIRNMNKPVQNNKNNNSCLNK
jgi:hypothetical protein